MGSLYPNRNPDSERQYCEMYIHDASYGNEESNEDEPTHVATQSGQLIVLPKSCSNPDKVRVVNLFSRLFNYIRSSNVWVRDFITAAEELAEMRPSDIEHHVLLIRGKRSADAQRKRAREEDVTGRSPFAVNAGHHGRPWGLSEMCLLCPRAIAEDEKSCIILNARGGGLRDIPIEHCAFDAMYHVLLHPTGYTGWEDNMPVRSGTAIQATLPRSSIRGRPRGSTAFKPRSKVSMLEYYAYRLHPRRGLDRTDNCMFMTNRLFQEYACVAFWRVETSRLNIHRMNQEGMRAARQAELRLFAAAVANGTPTPDIGRISYIPESFVGGPKDMYACYQDAMAAVLRHGAPSLFITFTANPKWPDVVESIRDQASNERPDIIARVFKIKLNALLEDLKTKLGEQLCRIYVVEFQKRGLPHAHIVVILKEGDRPMSPADIDSLSSAELPPLPADDDDSPEAEAQRRLRKLVLEHMVHNDCSGPDGRRCPCWDDVKKRCGGNFPFEFAPTSSMGDERRKAVYRRRRGAAWTANVNSRQITNQWIVPYCAAFLLAYECHINVEVVTQAYAIKYLFKYVFKGHDNASSAVHATKRDLDQIGNYQDHRYLGAAEAFWRLFKFSIHDSTETVYRMVVDIKEERRQRYVEGNEVDAADREMQPRHLEAYVAFCGSCERDDDPDDAWRTLTLSGFPEKYSFDKGVWSRRTDQRRALGRMYAIHPSKGDAFYLRLLLCSIVGSDVRELARRWTGDEHDVRLLRGDSGTFQQACYERGLLFHDGEWNHALTEATNTASSEQLRGLFLHILCFCQPSSPTELFESHWKSMGDDLFRYLEDIRPSLVNDHNLRILVLHELRISLDPHTSDVEAIALGKLPQLSPGEQQFIESLTPTYETTLPHIYNYIASEQSDAYEAMYEMCSSIEAQKSLLDLVQDLQRRNQQYLIFVDAPGGCGKTFVFNCLLAWYRSQELYVLAVATTGIAALQLAGGKTVHTGLKVPLDTTGTRQGKFPLNIDRNTKLGEFVLHKISLLLWDEAAMADKDLLESVDFTFRELRNDDRPFGGVCVLLGGDFRQCLPVVPGATREEQVAHSILTSPVFRQFAKERLHTNIRVQNCLKEDPTQAAILHAWADTLIGIGENDFAIVNPEVPFTSHRPTNVRRKGIQTMADVHGMIKDVFGSLATISQIEPSELMCEPMVQSAILCPLNVSAEFINKCCLEQWERPLTTKFSIDEYTSDKGPTDALVVTVEHLNAQTPNGSPPHRLDLKIGMPLILLRNMANGLMNGTRMILQETKPYVLRCMVVNGPQAGQIVYLPRFLFKHEGADQPLKWQRRQFPVRPCWAMTINKSQGQTLIHVAICLVQIVPNGHTEDGAVSSVAVGPAEVFGHGQFYVGLSRSGNPTKVCIYTTMDQLDKDTIINVVYPEALPMAQRGQPDGIVFATPQDVQPINSSATIIDNVLDEMDSPREILTNIYRDGVRLPASHEFEDVPFHGNLFDGESSGEPNVCHMDDVEHIYFYNDYYNRRIAQMAHDSEADTAWVEQVLNGSDWDFDSEDDQ
jgi:hypothetical protein